MDVLRNDETVKTEVLQNFLNLPKRNSLKGSEDGWIVSDNQESQTNHDLSFNDWEAMRKYDGTVIKENILPKNWRMKIVP